MLKQPVYKDGRFTTAVQCFTNGIRYVQEAILGHIHALIILAGWFRQGSISRHLLRIHRSCNQIKFGQSRRSFIYPKFYRTITDIQLVVINDRIPVRFTSGLLDNLFEQRVHRSVGRQVRQSIIYRSRT